MRAFRLLSRRDVVLVLLGAISMQLLGTLLSQYAADELTGDSDSSIRDMLNARADYELLYPTQQPLAVATVTHEIEVRATAAAAAAPPAPTPVELMDTLPETTVVSHAPGWTLFKDVYMAGGTLFVVSSAPKSTFPEARYMISNPLEALNTPENIAAREPSDSNICWLSPETAKSWWGGNVKFGERNRVWSVEGGTLLNNDPPQCKSTHRLYHV